MKTRMKVIIDYFLVIRAIISPNTLPDLCRRTRDGMETAITPYMRLTLFLFLVLASHLSLAKNVPFNCDHQEIIKTNNIKDAILVQQSKIETLYNYQDGSIALHLVCKNNFPKKIFVRRKNSYVMADLVYNLLGTKMVEVKEFKSSKTVRKLHHKHLYKKINNTWVRTQVKLFNTKEETEQIISETFFDSNDKHTRSQIFHDYEDFDILKLNYTNQRGSISGFIGTDKDGKVVREYNSNSLPQVTTPATSKDTNILVLDSGYDLNHTSLRPYLKKPFSYLNAEFPNKIPSEVIEDIDKNYPPFSHGTMTASIALRDLDYARFLPLSGDPRYYDLEKTKNFLKNNMVDFANISFYLPSKISGGQRGKGSTPRVSKPSKEALGISILMDLTPETLWVVAAANGPMNMGVGIDIDTPASKMYPASFESDNMLVVGAINTDTIVDKDLPLYQITRFSNFGQKSVDIFAPGKSVTGAALGGGYESWTGTSFSAPIVLNLCAKIHENNRNLTPLLIKKIVLLSAYVNIEDPMPAKSGGIIYPERAFYLANMVQKLDFKILKDTTLFNTHIKKLAVVAHEKVRVKNHPMVDNWKSRLMTFWQDRGL